MRKLMCVPVLLLLCSCSSRNTSTATAERASKMTVQVTSTAFKEGGSIPSKYTCEGQDVSPPLAWNSVPEGTRSIALIADDPDAPGKTWVHWVLYNLPPSLRELPENVPASESILGNGGRQGMTDFGKIGYGGPCPPSGTHRYFFKVYALDSDHHLDPGLTKAQLVKAMEGHVLAEGQLMGTYAKKQ